ncbi:DUF2268 domain-containing putative Zn-dependent protease [Clostridium tagluense]|uniref:DUF2268 domain-containing putative Zn-dependent protease n=1 Tax=Clostridium tagluense TaxID=360422 RepID=UPI001CF2D2C1|nr:DUF2268 domain-containing putative Zn-dependent protease [Clostridium tagluense]MCB2309793.1 DUF2268 domain-containing putative Zn-dependent protease [Clostridium tagluense]MCB2314677.1 DUF2268 domain-containing putative Zn-dependent protease [Clostridium tagluense]MCB2319525.1 DUF2268 domain-containing putative Zn-dependent protease [Clostridium tagluense]MCB2324387.1 DUF2268 domain-containing putative Zn-dependent protease [Clostridium tagluense]MCB2329238.1 DUF2268 domain-containing puta
MENKIINLAIKQMKSDSINEIFSQESFFEEYFKVFCDNKPFDENIINSIQHDLDINNVINLSNTLINKFLKKVNILSRMNIISDIGLIIFIGDGNIDGHSIILNKYAYLFIDLNAIISRSDKNYDLDAFLSHEIIHAVHYDLNKEFYPKNYNLTEDKYFKTLIAEGMATYMSIYLFGIPENSAYWLGFLAKNEVDEWVCNCENMRMNIGISLKKLISNKKFDKNIYDRLFCIIRAEKLTSYRVGYYYGCEIIKMACYENSINEAFRLKFNDIKKYVNAYFKITIV